MITTIEALIAELRIEELTSAGAMREAANRRDAMDTLRRTPEGAADVQTG